MKKIFQNKKIILSIAVIGIIIMALIVAYFVLIDASNDWHVRRVSKVNIVLKCRSLCYTKNNRLFDRFCNKERQ